MSYETDLEQRNQELEERLQEAEYHFQLLFQNSMNIMTHVQSQLLEIRRLMSNGEEDTAFNLVGETTEYIARRSYTLGSEMAENGGLKCLLQ